jgi:hypothetical protein
VGQGWATMLYKCLLVLVRPPFFALGVDRVA